jgi:acetyl-CoA carboxylase biotin carboxyl carrier protein
MNLKEIQQLIEIINLSDLDEVIIKDGQTEITTRRTCSKVTEAAPTAPSVPHAIQLPAPHAAVPEQLADAPVISDLLEIRSPIVGTFYRAASPDSPPFTSVDERIKPGDVLCIIEAMKLMNEIEAEVSGTVVEVLVENGEPVEYNQVLFRVKP